ncbi:hypothetical protein ACFE04_011522 [Oxalis oulophora]
MAASKKPPKLERPPIRYRWNSVEGASFALADFIHQENTPTLPKSNSKCSCQESDLRDVMGTPELISTVERIWNSATNLPFLKTKENLNLNHSGCQKNFNFSNLCEGETERLPPSDDFKCSIVKDQSLPSNIEFPKVTQKMSGLESLAKISSWRLRHLSNEAWRGMGLTSVKYLNELRNVNQPIGEICCTEEKSNSALGDVNSNSDLVKSQDPPSCSGVHVADANVCLQNTRMDENFGTENENSITEIPSACGQKLQGAGVKQEHAVAGALAGVFVSLSLHPVDTVKTVIQSCRADQKSIYDIGKSIISERGLSGLYRGIASNIASSAPISAVYTLTYESIKGALLPRLPKEYSSVAHCVGAGCASVATSFIFTPSERVKQQMQVGSQYRNSWNALIGILRNGGLPSLYTGWGAVLCRNVPHSIIKFYTYETLKQMMMSSQSSAQPTTLQTLVCGGIAGSTAALFTTPFDVVKTRLQTQTPGCMSQYSSVGHALGEICRHEGLKGLYRGLIPRLVIYMSQGALFFASYEFFKSVLSLELSRRIQQKENKVNDSALLQPTFPLTTSSSP